MIPITQLLPYVAAHATAAPDPVLADCMVMTARDLCRDCLCLPYQFTLVDVSAGSPEVDLYDMPRGHQLLQATTVTLGGATLTITTPHRIERADPNWRDTSGTPREFFLTEYRNQLYLYPTPIADHSLTISGYLEPVLRATDFVETFVDRYADVLISGTLSRILRYPGYSWTNVPLAQDYRVRYELEKRIIRSRATDASQRGIVRTVRYGGY